MSAESLTLFAIQMKRCELESELVRCFCTSWPLYSLVIDSIRGQEEEFFRLICGCDAAGTADGSISAMSLALAFGTTDDAALAAITLQQCGGLGLLCCLSDHWRRVGEWRSRWGVDGVSLLHRYLCACAVRPPRPDPATPPPTVEGAPTAQAPTAIPAIEPTALCDYSPASADLIIDKGSR